MQFNDDAGICGCSIGTYTAPFNNPNQGCWMVVHIYILSIHSFMQTSRDVIYECITQEPGQSNNKSPAIKNDYAVIESIQLKLNEQSTPPTHSLTRAHLHRLRLITFIWWMLREQFIAG